MHNASTLGSIGLGRYNGLPIRLHVSCLLVGVFVFFFRTQVDGDPLGDTGIILLVWLACVLLHEAGHFFAVNRIGGTNEMLVLTPFGGLSFHSFPQQAGKDLWVAISGPLLSLLGFAAASGLLCSLENDPVPGLFGADGRFFSASALVIGLRLAVWINLGLTVFNLLPTIPFDGGWMLHALLWPAFGDRQAWRIVRRASLATALGLILLAIWADEESGGGVPLWLPLTVVAVYCFCFSAVPLPALPGSLLDDLADEEHLHPAEDPDPPSRTSREEDNLELLHSWQSEQAAFAPSTDNDQTQEEESVVDEILQCVHARGLASLTQAQRQVLQKAAIRYRLRTPK
jgi:Zn-dependent protease